MQNIQITIKRKSEVIARLGIGRSTLQSRINEGIFPPPITLGGRSIGWLEHEVNEAIAALVLNQSHSEIKNHVTKIVGRRTELAKEFI
tara:strand:- start:200 stop:463 length:264 start_codon:yes stop_codon:yes gene_type:complete